MPPEAGAGQNSDWWLVYNDGTSWYYYNLSGGWLSGLFVSYQAPLVDVGSTIISVPGLSAGSYNFYFGVDTVMNGTIDTGSGVLNYVSVVVNVTSGILGTWAYTMIDGQNIWDMGTITFTGNYTSGKYLKINLYNIQYEGTYTVDGGTNVTIVESGQTWVGTF